MLVLTRKEDESVVIFPSQDMDDSMTVKQLFINGPIRVQVQNISGQVRLGIDAPIELTILREEINI